MTDEDIIDLLREIILEAVASESGRRGDGDPMCVMDMGPHLDRLREAYDSMIHRDYMAADHDDR